VLYSVDTVQYVCTVVQSLAAVDEKKRFTSPMQYKDWWTQPAEYVPRLLIAKTPTMERL